ncbi:MAG: flavin reductase family protein [Sphingobium sp.]|jgi:flavin reductase (DIM6/NTAB) family NADH-FMN oxidoreductase RutF|nr:flavin reductase family protein [Sphingobium sp.]MCI1272694.1 flavin reductase family protein [Sphingobium sp.]MCI1757327.1 flavin reductase family protein [Sphingobium sp.]MCI2053159.1 flavin reductase family protein [Sphingobium sp.]
MSQRFIDAMRYLAGAVTIISAGTEDAIAGLTATAICSFSADPPRILACLNRAGGTYKALVDSGQFCVNILAADQQDLAIEFAGRTGKTGAEKFADGCWETSDKSPPRHLGALASVRCTVHLCTLLGTHAIVIGDVVETHIGETRPSLLYREGAFLTG